MITRPEWLHNKNVFRIDCVMTPDSMVMLNYLTKITLPKSVSNYLGNVFCPKWYLFFPRKKKSPAPIKIELALPPPKKKPRYPPPPKPRNFMGMEVFLQKEPRNPRHPWIGAEFLGRGCDETSVNRRNLKNEKLLCSSPSRKSAQRASNPSAPNKIGAAAAFWGFLRGGFPENACIGGAISERNFCEICRRKSPQNTEKHKTKLCAQVPERPLPKDPFFQLLIKLVQPFLTPELRARKLQTSGFF